MTRIGWALLGWMLTGCGGQDSLHFTADDGFVCLDEHSDSYRFVFDTGCLSSSCDPIEELSCDTTRTGTTLVVQAELWVGQPKANACTDDCGTALCPLSIDEAIATIQHGQTVVAVQAVPPCEG